MVSARKLCWMGVLLSLTACQMTQTKGQSRIQQETTPTNPEQTPIVAPTTTPVPQTSQSQTPRYSALEKRFLTKAERAFRKGNFFYPTHDNAFDRFNAVVLLNPDNQQAKAGLQAILLRYTNVTRDALANGRLDSAKNYLHELEEFYPDQPLVAELRRQLNAKLKTVYRPKEQIMQAEKNLEFEEIKLSKSELSDKSEAIKNALGSIALRLQSSDESILIFARSDNEGRWIYKQMKEAVSDYRIRGDIRISSIPKIRILPPL